MRTLIASTFLDSLAALVPNDQARVNGSTNEFCRNSEAPGGSYHRLENARDAHFWSLRASRDLRIIVYQRGDTRTLLYAAHHDAAYRWAARHEFEINSANGAMQIVEVEETVREVEKEIERHSYVGHLLFAHLDDDYLMAIGVPARWLGAVKATREDGLIHLFDHLPEEALENLVLIAEGQPVPVPETPEETSDPFEHPDAQRRFQVVGGDEEALQRALAQPRERWTVFLHPSQRSAVEARYRGPAKVSGGAGTGKTVVALHRAAALARRSVSDGDRILLTTYTRTLARRLEQNLELLLGDSGPERERVEVVNLHQLARRLLDERGRTFRPLDDRTLRPLLQRVAGKIGSGADVSLLLREWREVLDPHGVTGLQQYLRVRRAGTGRPMQQAERIRLWQVFGPVLEETLANGLLSWDRLCHEAAALLEEDGNEPFRHVVADEVQDFGPAELRLLRALAPDAEDDLFLAGDVGQRIYQTGSSYARHGIEVRGRSTILRLNYRTTEQIRRYADALLPGALTGDDEIEESRTNVSLLRGPEPDLVGFLDANDEARHLAERLRRWLGQGLEPGDIALFARTRRLLDLRARTAVELAGLAVQELDDDAPIERGAVAVGTMHRAKGLEFRAVVVLGVEEGVLPLRQTLLGYASERGQAAFRERERNLLYVACTRARGHLVVTWVGLRSALLAEVSTPTSVAHPTTPTETVRDPLDDGYPVVRGTARPPIPLRDRAWNATKRIVCLAMSRKIAGACVAGKEYVEAGPPRWIRPISSRPGEEVAPSEYSYPDGAIPRLLDLVAVPLLRRQPHMHQQENWVLDSDSRWTRSGRVDWQDLAALEDLCDTLWLNGHQTKDGVNDRVPEALLPTVPDSLKLIRVDALVVDVHTFRDASGYARQRLRGRFRHHGVDYALWITDPSIETRYRERGDGRYTVGGCYLTISLGKPHRGDAYKLIAAVIERPQR